MGTRYIDHFMDVANNRRQVNPIGMGKLTLSAWGNSMLCAAACGGELVGGDR